MKKSTLRNAWVWFWYNDVTRCVVVLLPSYFLVLVPLLLWLGMPPEAMKPVLSLVYTTVLCWATIDNDYSKLEDIGLDVNRRPLKNVTR